MQSRHSSSEKCSERMRERDHGEFFFKDSIDTALSNTVSSQASLVSVHGKTRAYDCFTTVAARHAQQLNLPFQRHSRMLTLEIEKFLVCLLFIAVWNKLRLTGRQAGERAREPGMSVVSVPLSETQFGVCAEVQRSG